MVELINRRRIFLRGEKNCNISESRKKWPSWIWRSHDENKIILRKKFFLNQSYECFPVWVLSIRCARTIEALWINDFFFIAIFLIALFTRPQKAISFFGFSFLAASIIIQINIYIFQTNIFTLSLPTTKYVDPSETPHRRQSLWKRAPALAERPLVGSSRAPRSLSTRWPTWSPSWTSNRRPT